MNDPFDGFQYRRAFQQAASLIVAKSLGMDFDDEMKLIAADDLSPIEKLMPVLAMAAIHQVFYNLESSDIDIEDFRGEQDELDADERAAIRLAMPILIQHEAQVRSVAAALIVNGGLVSRTEFDAAMRGESVAGFDGLTIQILPNPQKAEMK